MVEVTVASKTKQNYYELEVIRIIKNLKDCNSLTTFEDNFKVDCSNVPRRSTATVDTSYRVRWIGDKWTDPNAYITIVHTGVGKTERIVATIKRK